jgi:phage FluMu protein Com
MNQYINITSGSEIRCRQCRSILASSRGSHFVINECLGKGKGHLMTYIRWDKGEAEV